MMKKIVLTSLLILPLLLTSCFGRRVQPVLEPRIDETGPTEVVLTYAVKLNHEKGLKLEDSQVYYDRDIHRVELVFSTQKILELREARELLVDVVEGLLERIYTHPKMDANLNGSFTADNLEIHINLESFWPLYGDPMYVGWIVLEEGMAYYYAADLKDFYGDFWHSRIEPYYKSLEFVTVSREAEIEYKRSLPKPPPRALMKERAILVGGE